MKKIALTFAAIAVMVVLGGFGSGASWAKSPSLPKGGNLKLPDAPVTLHVVDVGGDLTIAKPMIEAYKKEHPDLLERVTYTTGDTAELAAKLKAQEDSGNLQIDVILGGNIAVGPTSQQGLLQKLLPNYKDQLGSSIDTYLPGAKKFLDVAGGYAVVNDFGNYGPLLEYIPANVSNPPKTLQELLKWAKEHPGKFMYGKPANSTPGEQFVNALPYMLGDSDKNDPASWDKTWAYLKKLDKYIDYYPAGTGETMKQLGEGSRYIVMSGAGWYINPMAIGIVPKSAEVVAMKNTTYILDGNYIFVPKGISADKLAVILDMMKWMLTPEQQVNTYDEGYLYPGPSVKGVSLDMAPKKSREVLNDLVPDGFDDLLNKYDVIPPLDSKQLGEMNDIWERKIGARTNN